MELCTVIVHFGDPLLTRAAVASLQSAEGHNNAVVVVNNDPNNPVRQDDFGSAVVVLVSEGNPGFAAGSNIGIRHALASGAEWILLLNNDCRLAHDALEVFYRHVRKEPGCRLVTGRIYCDPDRERLWFGGGRIDWWRGVGIHLDKNCAAKSFRVDFASGCLLFIHREVFSKVGLLDPSFFLYVEDLDFCHRCAKAGFHIVFHPGIRAWHRVSSSTGGDRSTMGLYYGTRNRIWFMRRYAPPFKLCFFALAFGLHRLFLLSRLVVDGRWQSAGAIWRGWREGWLSSNGRRPPG